MPDKENKKQYGEFGDELDLKELFLVLFRGKWIISSTTTFLLIIGIFYSLSLPDIYESKALLAPVDESDLATSSLGGISSLAGLAGIALPTSDSGSNSKKAIEMMVSLNFFENQIMPKIFLPNLIAVKSWDNETNTIFYDESIFDINSNTWFRNSNNPKKSIPSAQQSYNIFKNSHLKIIPDDQSGYIVLTIKHQSPFIAKKWTETVFEEINSFYRQKDKAQSQNSVIYLNEQMAKTRFSEIKQVTAELLGQEIQKLTLIEANLDYVFEYVYPPDVMEQKSEPNRLIIILLFLFVGFISGAIFVLIRNVFSSDEKKAVERFNG